ncbi:hypothetical protein BN1723_004318 [Verticillium longisporum]|uniref:Uncharacterized protein n=1 Tax=Verticillium longisporum TaxID=100787 RepID=A0A0G4MSX4_VERLO|nr:hypothetical protein BN1723_004318 [Verticillium longisporum]
MKLPYSFLQPSGNVLFAARGGKIHSFNLEDNTYLATWQHPDVEKSAGAGASKSGPDTKEGNGPASALEVTGDTSTLKDTAEAEVQDGPPAKRQRLQEEQDAQPDKDEGAMDVDEPSAEDQKKGSGFKNRKQKQKERQYRQGGPNVRGTYGRTVEQPLISHLLVTSSGSHLVAVSGHDKTIWTFEHDGRGALTLFSQRPMPKRPCTALISPDDKLILSADKFGDVYTLPLLGVPSAASEEPQPASSKPVTESSKEWKPQGTNLTVHSRRNLEALQQQQSHAAKAHALNEAHQAEKVKFEHNLIIGHVSLLTAMILAQKGERRYIVTADRDEHIRLSRYVPQAHVIEGYCLGHTHFVSALTILPTRPDVLISGGGDVELYAWDWEASKLLAKFDLLPYVAQAVAGEAPTKLAVLQLTSVLVTLAGENTPSSLIFVTCEGVPAIIIFQTDAESIVKHHSLIPTSGNPLHIAHISGRDGVPARAIVALDPGEATEPVETLSLSLAGGAVTAESFKLQDDEVTAAEAEVSQAEVRKLLYSVEDLRKHDFDGDEAAEEGKNGQEDKGTGA